MGPSRGVHGQAKSACTPCTPSCARLHDVPTSAAPPDLLDILSKGSNPQLILRHLPKNFDNIHNLSFRHAWGLAGTGTSLVLALPFPALCQR